jgi:hypothetical protein
MRLLVIFLGDVTIASVLPMDFGDADGSELGSEDETFGRADGGVGDPRRTGENELEGVRSSPFRRDAGQ